jgi:photosystem II stability/assembly factor-like uncharacterized protein
MNVTHASNKISWAVMALLAVGCGTANSPGPPAATTPARTPSASTSAPAAVRSSATSAGNVLWLDSLQMSTPSTGWALYLAGSPWSSPVGTPSLLIRTTDGARTWTDVTPPAARPLLSTPSATQVLYAAGAERAYLAVTTSRNENSGSTTRVFATGDGGRTWTESAPVRADGYASQLTFADPEHGWMLVNEGAAMDRDPVQVYRTTDGGAHWSLTAQSPPINSGSDSGIPVACDKSGITFASATTGWITSYCAVGLSGELLVSRDRGVTWTPQPLPVPVTVCGDTGCVITGPQFTDGTGFLTVGAYGGAPTLLATRDLGRSWHTVSLPAGYAHKKYPYPQVEFFDPRHGIVVPGGSQGKIGAVFFTTADGGGTWTAVPQGVHFTQLGAAIDFVSPAVGFAWILGGDWQGASPPPVYETTNSGRTWTRFTPRLAS